MNQRDTIIIAALLNAAILAVLFLMAINVDSDAVIEQPEIAETLVNSLPLPPQEPTFWAMEDSTSFSTDEVDDLLRDFASAPPELVLPNEELSQALENNSNLSFTLPDIPQADDQFNNIVQITVKRGDNLERIARANSTSVEDIKRINRLHTERLAIGQSLKIPVGSQVAESKLAANKGQSAIPAAVAPAAVSSVTVEPEYYTVKSGDNPWKIAKQCHVKMDDLLRLNNLDESKARNMKIGDKIRIR